MYKNLNQYTSTSLDVKFNNTNQLTDIGKQFSTAISFTKGDVQLDLMTGEKYLVVKGRIIKHCIIKCPNGQVWTDLDYKYHIAKYDGDIQNTTFNFTYIQDDQWEDGLYWIYVGTTDKRDTFSNAPQEHGVQLLRSVSQHNYIKKLIAGDNVKLLYNDNSVVISCNQHNYTSQPIILDQETKIDVSNGNVQICYTLTNDVIVDLINSKKYVDGEQNSSDSSEGNKNSYTSQTNTQQQVISVTLFVYKPNDPIQTNLKYKDIQILKKYDVGWFAFSVRKMLGSLFISQPTRVITDFNS